MTTTASVATRRAICFPLPVFMAAILASRGGVGQREEAKLLGSRPTSRLPRARCADDNCREENLVPQVPRARLAVDSNSQVVL